MAEAITSSMWSRTGPPAEDALPAASRELIDRLRAQSPVTDLHRWVGQAPDGLAAWVGFAAPLRRSAAVTAAIRELVILRVAHRRGSARTVRHHQQAGPDAGLTDEQLHALDGPIDTDLFNPAALDALAITDLVLDHHPVTGAQLHPDGLSMSEVVHVVMLVTHYDALITLLSAFGMQ
jgi:4-carboxymuconolactone decarboxylase